MMTKQQQIVEMAKAIDFAINNECKLNSGKSCKDCQYDNKGDWKCQSIMMANYLYNEDYRKVTKDDIIVNKEEYAKLVYEREEYLNDRFAVCHALRQSRKQTAKEIWLVGKYYYSKHASKDVAMNMFTDWIKNEYEIEVD